MLFLILSQRPPPDHLVLPRDVWHAIAEFVPDEDLAALYSVNSAFLQRYLRMRYTQVCIRKWHDRTTCELLDHIKLPLFAQLVRDLDVRMCETKQLDIQGRPGITASRLGPHHSIRRNANSCFTAALAFFRRAPPTFTQTMDLLLSAMPNLTDVRSFSVDCWDLDPAYSLYPFFSIAWSSFGLTLTKLTLHVNLTNFLHLSASAPILPALSTLEVEVTVNLFNVGRCLVEERETLESRVAPFISKHATQLHSLTFRLWTDFDLSVFFSRFPLFPKLRYLRIRLSYNRCLEDPTSLLRLFTTSTPVLRDVQIRLNPTAPDKRNETPLAQFLAQLANEPTGFGTLTALDLFPTHLPEGMPILLAAVRHALTSLTKLCVRDRSLKLAELKELVDVLNKCEDLEMLRFNIATFDFEVMDVIATGLPKLKRLSIFIDESWDSEPAISPKLESDLAAHSFSTWSLRDIGIWKAGVFVNLRLMHALARSIPSVVSFWGNGHMDQGGRRYTRAQ